MVGATEDTFLLDIESMKVGEETSFDEFEITTTPEPITW